jgi:hypothetical protein
MRVLLVGAGGVGAAATGIAARRDFFELFVVADYDLARAERAVEDRGKRFVAARVDASSPDAVAALCREHGITHVLNAVDPRFVMPIFNGAFAAGADYLDLAMSLSHPHPERPYTDTGVKLGDEQFAVADEWATAGRLALVGIGVEPGLSDVFARYGGWTLGGSPSSTVWALSSSRCCARCTSWAWIRRSRCGSAGCRSRPVTWWPPACPTRRRWATGCAAGPAPGPT